MPARLIIVGGFLEGRTYDVADGETFSIGRSSDNSLQILERSLSRRHCEITLDGDGQRATLRDMGSTFGTRVNDDKIKETDLNEGDRIFLGQGELVLEFHLLEKDDTDEQYVIVEQASTEELDSPQVGSSETVKRPTTPVRGNGTPIFIRGGAHDLVPKPAEMDRQDPEKPVLPQPRDSDADPWLGQTFEGYAVQERLGGRKSGAVYRATHGDTKQQVALRLLPNTPDMDRDQLYRFLQSGQLSSQFQHPNLVALLGSGMENECYYLATEYLDGGSVRRRLEQSGAFALDEGARIARLVAMALGELHVQGVFHQRVTPDNILLGAEQSVKLAGLGLAADVRMGPGDAVPQGVDLADLPYLAPELLQGHDSPQSDLYALGATLYEMLTGMPPLSADTPEKLIDVIRNEPPAPLRQVRADVPAPLEVLVHGLLEKDPGARPAAARDIIEYLDMLSS